MSGRERLMAIGVVLLVVGFLGYRLLRSFLVDPLQNIDSRIASAKDTIAKYDRDLTYRTALEDRLDELRGQALPFDEVLAKSEYQKYLNEKIAAFPIYEETVAPGSVNADRRRQYYMLVEFSVQGVGRIDHIVAFLDSLLADPVLQQIRSLRLSPKGDREKRLLKMHVRLMALAIPGTQKRASLAGDESASRRALEDTVAFASAMATHPLFQRVFHAAMASQGTETAKTFVSLPRLAAQGCRWLGMALAGQDEESPTEDRLAIITERDIFRPPSPQIQVAIQHEPTEKPKQPTRRPDPGHPDRFLRVTGIIGDNAAEAGQQSEVWLHDEKRRETSKVHVGERLGRGTLSLIQHNQWRVIVQIGNDYYVFRMGDTLDKRERLPRPDALRLLESTPDFGAVPAAPGVGTGRAGLRAEPTPAKQL